MHRTIIIIPAYNEEDSIRQTLDDILAQELGIDIVVVNDGSSDNTAEEVSRDGINIINLPFNLGYGAAVETGFRYAVKKGYSRCILIDADGQHDPKYIKLMLEKMDSEDHDVIIGSRFKGDADYDIPASRRLGMSLFRRLVRIITKQDILDVTSGYQLLNKKALLFLLDENYPADYPDSDVIVKLILTGFKVAEVPVVIRDRKRGISMHSSKLKTVYYVYKMILSLFLAIITHQSNRKV
jgi:glycosyltransferase involved in cell wall biosynthesis